MTDEMDDLFSQVTPRSVSSELRPRVLSLVNDELAAPSQRKRRSRLGRGILLGLVAAVILNLWVTERQRARLAELYGPDVPSKTVEDLRKLIESATDAETAQWFAKQLQSARTKGDRETLRREQAALAATANS